MKSFVKNLWAILLYKRRAIGFGFVWLICWPIVFLRYTFSDLVNLRFRHRTASVKTHLVRKSVYYRFVESR